MHDGTLHGGSGGFPLPNIGSAGPGVTSNIGAESLVPITGPNGAVVGYFLPGTNTFLTPEEAQTLATTGVWPTDTPTPQQFAPQAFGSTQQGFEANATLQRQLEAARNAASLEQQRVGDAAALQRSQLNATTQQQIARLQESEAFRRVQAQIGSDQAIAQFEASEQFRRQVLSEVGAGARAEIEQAGAFRRSLLSELGAGARGDVQAFTTQRGQSISAVQDTFNRLSDLATTPSDFRRLAFNVEGIQPPGSTPTDTLRDRMAQFFQQQLGFAGREPQTFGETFGGLQEQFPIPEAESFSDVFNRTRQQVGVPAPTRLQFGGSAKGAAIVGEKGPELVFNPSNVIPNLSKGEMRALKKGGVRGAQFGTNSVSSNVPQPTQTTPDQNEFARQLIQQGGNIFDLDRAKLGGRLPTPTEPFFNTLRAGQSPAFSPSVFNTPGVTASGFLAPDLPSLSQFNALLPFMREQLFGAFGENVFSAGQFASEGFDPLTATPSRPGIDPASVLAAIRRFSPIGRTSPLTRFG